MKQDQISYQQIFRTFGIQPVCETSFCRLFKEGKRHFCVYHNQESGKIQCLYINTLEYTDEAGLLSLLSPYHDLQRVTLDENHHEYPFVEQTTSEFIVKWCYSIKKAGTGGDLPDGARAWFAIFNDNKDIYLSEDHHVKVILRDPHGTVTDILQYRDHDFEVNFSNGFGSWHHRPDTSSLLHNLYTTNPYLIPSFFEENNQYHYHVHIVSGYHDHEFTQMLIQNASDSDVSLEPSFFLLNSLKDYMDFLGFLCHFATVSSRKNFFSYHRYTDRIVLEIIPFDSPLGHTGLTFKSWQTMFSQKTGEHVRLSKWQNRSGIYTGLPLKIDILHRLCLDLIHLNKLPLRIINRVLDVDAGDEQESLNPLYDEQIF